MFWHIWKSLYDFQYTSNANHWYKHWDSLIIAESLRSATTPGDLVRAIQANHSLFCCVLYYESLSLTYLCTPVQGWKASDITSCNSRGSMLKILVYLSYSAKPLIPSLVYRVMTYSFKITSSYLSVWPVPFLCPVAVCLSGNLHVHKIIELLLSPFY